MSIIPNLGPAEPEVSAPVSKQAGAFGLGTEPELRLTVCNALTPLLSPRAPFKGSGGQGKEQILVQTLRLLFKVLLLGALWVGRGRGSV